MDIYPAKLVKSRAGRDKNKFFAVFEVINEEYVLICDGRGRSLEKPKMKKIKHLEDMNYILPRIKEKSDEGKKISNSDIRKAIKTALNDLGMAEAENLSEEV